MATPPVALTPPPGQGPAQGPPPAPTSPVAASPAPATPSPIKGGTALGIQIVHMLKALASTYPAAAPHVRKVLDDMRPVLSAVMTEGQTGEAQAPPTDG